MKKIDIDNIPLDDKATWDAICSGETVGFFQLDSSIGARVAKMASPHNIIELAHVLALQRPPCLIKDANGRNILDRYCSIKWNKEPPSYIHDCLRPILSNTLSLIIFQEQLIEIANKVAGYTLEDADILRYAVGHKISDVMAAEKDRFIHGVKQNGYGDDIAVSIWESIENAASYLFNYSHAIEYAHLTYQTAYLKTHYPTEFMTSLFMFSKYDTDTEGQVERYYNECKRMGIMLLPPSIKKLNNDFEMIDNDKIAFGLSHIKGIGDASINKIRKNFKEEDLKDFASFIRFSRTSKINKGVVEALIMSGALDYFKMTRKAMMEYYSIFLIFTQREENEVWRLWELNRKEPISNCIIDMINGGTANKRRAKTLLDECSVIKAKLTVSDEYQLSKILLNEKRYLNVTLTDSMENCIAQVKDKVTHDILSLGLCLHKEKVCVGGVVESIKEILTKNKDRMAFVSISDFTYKTDIIIFPNIWQRCKEKIEEGSILLAWGLADAGKVIANKVETYEVINDRKKRI